ncbi:ATPase, partial [Candidatus Magnetomorum sp. HK-1]
YYLYDIGLRNSILKDYSEISGRDDKGILMESFVFLSMLKQIKANMELKFWRTKHGDEVDFILLKNRIPYPFEVKYNLSKSEIPKGLKKFLKYYPNVQYAFVVSIDYEDTLDFQGKKIFFIKWESIENLEVFENI